MKRVLQLIAPLTLGLGCSAQVGGGGNRPMPDGGGIPNADPGGGGPHIFQETFENIPLGDVDAVRSYPYITTAADCVDNAGCTALLNNGWDYLGPNCDQYCTMSIVSAPFGRSGHVLRYEYRSDQDNEQPPQQDAHNANLIKTFTPVSELWGRVWFATDVDTAACPTCTTSQWFDSGTKLHYIKPVDTGPSFVTGYPYTATGAPVSLYASQSMAVCPSGSLAGGCNNNFQNLGSDITVQDKQWYCFEYHIKLNSANDAADGVIEFYITSPGGTATLVQQYLNQTFVDGKTPGVTLDSAKIGQIEVFRQHSNHMIRYEDNITWDTKRIGCG